VAQKRDGLAEDEPQGLDCHHPIWRVARYARPRRLGSDDPEALTYLPEAQALEDNDHKVLTQKAEARNEPR
jgi:hypothetical protein